MRPIVFLLFYAALMSSCFAQDETSIIASSPAECSGITPKKAIPRYPAQALRDRKDGKVVVAVWIDSCGSVQQTELVKSSGNALLNAAAIDAANNSVFKPENSSFGKLSRIEVPYQFTSDKKEYKSEKPFWPASHKKAYFVLSETPFPFQTVQEALNMVSSQPSRLLSARPVQRMLQLKNEKGDVWLFLADNTTYKFKIAARYQRVQAENPTVSVQVLCDPSIRDCEKMKAILLKSGLLPFARSLNL
jgi:TonB family protein